MRASLTDSTVILEGIVMLLLRAAGVNRAPLARASMSLKIPSGFSRWSFRFNLTPCAPDTIGLQPMEFQLQPNKRPCAPRYHRASADGVSTLA
jgi:hypothetical protein